MIDDKLEAIAVFLQSTEQITPEKGAEVNVIARETGLAKSTIHRIINSSSARRWGINRSNKKVQPYTYYVDNDILISYQTFYDANMKLLPQMFNDPDRQQVYEMMHKLLIKAVAGIQSVDYVKTHFASMIVNQPEESILKQWPALSSSGKVLNGLLLAFQNIKE